MTLSKKNKEEYLEGIASDVTKAQLNQRYDNKTKSIIAKAIAEALKETFA